MAEVKVSAYSEAMRKAMRVYRSFDEIPLGPFMDSDEILESFFPHIHFFSDNSAFWKNQGANIFNDCECGFKFNELRDEHHFHVTYSNGVFNCTLRWTEYCPDGLRGGE